MLNYGVFLYVGEQGNRFKNEASPPSPAPPEPTNDAIGLTDIRDLLKGRQ